MGRRIWIQERTRETPTKEWKISSIIWAFSVSGLLYKIYQNSHFGIAMWQSLLLWYGDHLHMESQFLPFRNISWYERDLGWFIFSKAARKSSQWPYVFTHLLNQAKLRTKRWKWKLIRDSHGSHIWQFWMLFFFFTIIIVFLTHFLWLSTQL